MEISERRAWRRGVVGGDPPGHEHLRRNRGNHDLHENGLEGFRCPMDCVPENVDKIVDLQFPMLLLREGPCP